MQVLFNPEHAIFGCPRVIQFCTSIDSYIVKINHLFRFTISFLTIISLGLHNIKPIRDCPINIRTATHSIIGLGIKTLNKFPIDSVRVLLETILPITLITGAAITDLAMDSLKPTEFIQGQLTGAALQEAKTVKRDNPLITWKGLVDHFTAKFAVVDEQFQLRAKITALRPSQFSTLAKFVDRFTHLTSYVDKLQCPSQLLVDALVNALGGSPAANHITDKKKIERLPKVILFLWWSVI